MRTATVTLCRAAVIGGPVVLAFLNGGFFDGPRLVAAIVAWALLAAAVLALPDPLPTTRAALMSLAGLVALTALTAASIGWSPLPGRAYHDLQLVVLYLGAFALALAVVRGRRAVRVLEPGLAAGALVVIGWGLADRLAPGLLTHGFSFAAGGRLHQPLTYWNAMGELAAFGFVLCVRLAGDRTRPAWLRTAGAGVAPVLATGLYLTFSRGAVAALAAGLVVVLAGRPTWSQLRALVVCCAAAAVAVVAAALLPALGTYNEDLGVREAEGAGMLAVLLACGVAAGALLAWTARRERSLRARVGPLPTRIPLGRLAVAAVVVAAAVFVVAAANDRGERAGTQVTTPQRFTSAASNRYDYWSVAVRSFVHHPLAGEGAGSFQATWLRERTIGEAARNAHSLYLETAAELGLAGLLALALFLVGVGWAAREAMRRAPSAAVGPLAAATVFAFHAGIDWDWQMPAVTLPALAAAAALVGLAES